MTDVFISYSRQNKPFAEKLFSRLESSGRDSWIDWGDIPSSAQWWQEIQEGIEAADNFVLVMTPESLSSPICTLEIAHAIKSSKRIIPVVYIQPQIETALGKIAAVQPDEILRSMLAGRDLLMVARDNWTHLGHINWIFFRDEDDFEAAFAKLVETIETDLNHVKTHTRLFLRVQEWEKKGRRPDTLLIGDEIAAAESWLTASADKKPAPTDQHRAYIHESRTAEENRKRILRNLRRATVILGFVGLLAVIVTVIAFNQASSAANRERNANQEIAIAGETLTAVPPTLNYIGTQISIGENRVESLRLANEADEVLQNVNSDKSLAILLGIRALQSGQTDQADAALQAALLSNYPIRGYVGHLDRITNSSFSPDGSYIVTASMDGTARLWETFTGLEVQHFIGHKGTIWGVSFSPDGHFIATAGQDGTARLWEISSGLEIKHFTGHTGQLMTVKFSPDGRYMVTASTDGTARIWDTSNGVEVRRFTHENGLSAAAFSSDGRYVLTAGFDSVARIWDVENGNELRQFIGHKDSLISAVFSKDGYHIITSSTDNTIRWWDIENGTEAKEFVASRTYLDSFDLSPDEKYIVTGSTDNTARLWDVETNREIIRFNGSPSDVLGVTFSPDGKYILTSGADNIARLWEVPIKQEKQRFVGHDWFVGDIAFSPDGNYVATASWDSTVRLWDSASGEQVRLFTVPNSRKLVALAFSPNGLYLAAGGNDGIIHVWDLETAQEVENLDTQARNVIDLDFSPDGQYLLSVETGSSMRLWEFASGNVIRIFSGDINEASFSPDGKHIAITFNEGSRNNSAEIWELSSGNKVQEFVGHIDYVQEAIFSPDGRILLTASNDNTVRLWDAESGREILVITGHKASVVGAAFSPDGRLFITASADETARIWETATGREIRRFSHDAPLSSIAFSPNGHYILTGSLDMTARLWEVEISDLIFTDFINYACSRAWRDFTKQERIRYALNSEPTCRQLPELQEDDSINITPSLIPTMTLPDSTWTAIPTRQFVTMPALGSSPGSLLTTGQTQLEQPVASATLHPTIDLDILTMVPLASPTPTPTSTSIPLSGEINIGETVTGTISNDERFDVWSFFGKKEQVIEALVEAENPAYPNMQLAVRTSQNMMNIAACIFSSSRDQLGCGYNNEFVPETSQEYTNVRIVITLPENTIYRIFVGDQDLAVSGNYTLSIKSLSSEATSTAVPIKPTFTPSPTIIFP